MTTVLFGNSISVYVAIVRLLVSLQEEKYLDTQVEKDMEGRRPLAAGRHSRIQLQAVEIPATPRSCEKASSGFLPHNTLPVAFQPTEPKNKCQ